MRVNGLMAFCGWNRYIVECKSGLVSDLDNGIKLK